jgi:hypothetical protein
MTAAAPRDRVWILDTGERRTVREILGDPRNIHRLGTKTIYRRLVHGDRSWPRLLRRPDRSEAARTAGRASPWSQGPNCHTERAWNSWNRLRRPT